MRNWIIALPREDMENCIRVKTFGMNRKGPMEKVQIGDGIVCYVTKERKIVALGEVTEPYFLDDSKIFVKNGIFPDRIRFEAHQFESSEEFDFISIIDKLELISNVAYWSVYLRNGFVEISQKDWDLIKTQTKHLALR